MRMGWKAGHSLEQGMRRHSSGWEAGRSPARGAVKLPPGSQSMMGSLELQCWAAVPVGTASGAAEGCLQHEYRSDMLCLRSRGVSREQGLHPAESIPVTLGMEGQALLSGHWHPRNPDQPAASNHHLQTPGAHAALLKPPPDELGGASLRCACWALYPSEYPLPCNQAACSRGQVRHGLLAPRHFDIPTATEWP